MKLKQKSPAQVMSISDRVVEVERIVGDDITFRAFIDIDTSSAIEYSVVSCRFRIFSSSEQRVDKPKLSSIDSSEVLHAPTIRKVKASQRYESVIARGVIDVTKKIPNDRIGPILLGKPARSSKIINFDSGDADATALDQVDSASTQGDSGSNDFIISYCNDLVSRSHVDPASIINDASFHSPVPKISRGLRTTGLMSSLDPKDIKFRNSFVDNGRKKLSVRLDSIEENVIEAPFTFKISKKQVGRYLMEVDAISSKSSHRIQTIKFSVDLRKAYENFIIPSIPPTLQVANVGSSRFIRIKQRDRNSTEVKIYRRSYAEKNDSVITHFSEIASISARPGEEVQFVDRPDSSSRSLYRVVSLNELSLTSGEFSSSIVPGVKSRERKEHRDSTTILARESGGRIVVSVFNIPNDVVSVRLVRRDLTIFEHTFATPGSVVDGPTRLLSRINRDVTFEDLASRPNTIYEYKVMTVNSFGDERESQRSSMVFFVGNQETQEGRALSAQSIKITNEQEAKVTFQLDAPAEQSTLDNIYEILINQGLSQQYVDEVKQNRELFGKIIAFEVFRFDSVSGLNESFGVIKEGIFEDSQRTRSFSNVSQLQPGRKYIYNYRLLIRAPSTLFDSAKVDRIDLETGKSFSTNLKKFNSPRPLTRGTLPSNVVQQRTFSKTGLKADPSRLGVEDLTAGRTSLTGATEMRIPEVSTEILDLLVEPSSRGNILRWRIKSGVQEIDHIIVYAEYNGKLAPLRALQYCGNNNMIYLDNHLQASSSEVSYYVKLVFLDFQQGDLVGPARVEEDAN